MITTVADVVFEEVLEDLPVNLTVGIISTCSGFSNGLTTNRLSHLAIIHLDGIGQNLRFEIETF